MTNQQLSTLIRQSRAKLIGEPSCPRHEIKIENGGCALCVLESSTRRLQRTVNQIMNGVVAPSWEREKI